MKSIRLASTAVAFALAANGCVSSDPGGGAAAPADTLLKATGSFSADIDKGTFKVDYTGAVATATLKHRLNKTPGGLSCIPSAHISVALKDGACKLEFLYEAGFAGEGLVLKTVNFHARGWLHGDKSLNQTIDCPGWTKEPAKGEVVYSSSVVEGALQFMPIGQPEAGMAKATLRNKELKTTFAKLTTMKFQGRKFDVDLSSITFKGDVISLGDENAQCVKTFHDYPKWELQDINPGSKGANNTYGLDAFKGKKVVVALVSDWCASCISQTKLMQKLQDKYDAAGKNAQMIVINDKKTNDKTKLTKEVTTIPIFQDVAGVDAWAKMDAPHAGKFSGSDIRNSGYGFAKNGAEIMYFKPSGDGSLNLTAFEQAVEAAVNAPDEP
ncbi:MAG: redoxin domain-containing protein [Deltaproteobacteria bacterium]|nr:redoxin domain-containing protein [Deltaproteobacteria bacterium]